MAKFCKKGHAIEGNNALPRSDGKGVRCRICRNEQQQRLMKKRRKS